MTDVCLSLSARIPGGDAPEPGRRRRRDRDRTSWSHSGRRLRARKPAEDRSGRVVRGSRFQNSHCPLAEGRLGGTEISESLRAVTSTCKTLGPCTTMCGLRVLPPHLPLAQVTSKRSSATSSRQGLPVSPHLQASHKKAQTRRKTRQNMGQLPLAPDLCGLQYGTPLSLSPLFGGEHVRSADALPPEPGTASIRPRIPILSRAAYGP